MSDLTCPKCQSPMRSYERSGLTVDQCTGCRGVFLDRGELERLMDAENAYYESEDPRQTATEERGFGGIAEAFGRGGSHQGKRRGGHDGRRDGFLGDLFD